MKNINSLRKLVFILLIVYFIALLVGCVSSNNVLGVIQNAPEVKMVGKTFGEVENQFGSLSMVYYDQGEALFVFEKTTICFFFDGFDIFSVLDNDNTKKQSSIPAAIVLRKISLSEVCTGVSGRVKDYGITDLNLLRSAFSNSELSSDNSESFAFHRTTSDGFFIAIYCNQSDTIEEDDELVVTKSENSSISAEESILNTTPKPTAAPTPTPTPKPKVVSICAGGSHVVGMREDGSVLIAGRTLNKQNLGTVEQWSDVTQLVAGYYYAAGLNKDGALLITSNFVAEKYTGDNIEVYHEPGDWIKQWTNIVTLFPGEWGLAGLKKDGTLLIVSGNYSQGVLDQVTSWKGIKSIAFGRSFVAGITSNNTVIVAGASSPNWNDIVGIAADRDLYGLKKDGTVVVQKMSGEDSLSQGKYNVEQWTDIVSISAGWENIVGLRKDGTVVATGRNDCSQCNVSDWSDIVAITTGSLYTLGLKADGTIVATGTESTGTSFAELYEW